MPLGKVEVRGVGYPRLDAVLFEEPLRQQELAEQVLILRAVIDDGDRPRLARTTLQHPFVRKHSPDEGVEVAERLCAHGVAGLTTTGALGAGAKRIQEGPSGVGVHLDEFRTTVAQMEITAHENPVRAEVPAGDRRRPGQGRPGCARPGGWRSGALWPWRSPPRWERPWARRSEAL